MKNSLLVTRKYGSAIRLLSLLTDTSLEFDDPTISGKGIVYVRACLAKALNGVLGIPERKREERFNKEEYKKTQIERMKATAGIETDSCRLCFAVYPFIQKYLMVDAKK